MSVLIEAISVVVSRSAVDRAYPGGIHALARVAPRETFCTDGYLVRIGFYAPEDAAYFAAMLEASGLRAEAAGAAADFVVVDQNLGPAKPCLWLETGRERDGTPVGWHALARRGVLHVPNEWRPVSGTRIGDAPGRPFSKFVRRVGREDRLDWYHDRRSGRLISMARPFPAH